MSKIQGIPEGYELVGLVKLCYGDTYIDEVGNVETWENAECSIEIRPKIVKERPICQWVRGMFKDGWIAQDDKDKFENLPGVIYFYSIECKLSNDLKRGEWTNDNDDEGTVIEVNPIGFTLPVFREDLPWTERLQKVGPTYEAT
jgi:hypothetical protein